MKKNIVLPLMVLTVSAFALTGCGESNTNAASATPETAVEDSNGTDGDEEAQTQPVEVNDAYAFATAEGARTGAIFATLKSNQQQADILVSARSELAEIVELHQNYTDPQTGAMLMRKTSGIDLAAGRTVTLEPKGFHIMLINLKRPLVEGEEFEATLQFRRAGRVTVPVKVTAPGLNPDHSDGHGHHSHDHNDEDGAHDDHTGHTGHDGHH